MLLVVEVVVLMRLRLAARRPDSSSLASAIVGPLLALIHQETRARHNDLKCTLRAPDAVISLQRTTSTSIPQLRHTSSFSTHSRRLLSEKKTPGISLPEKSGIFGNLATSDDNARHHCCEGASRLRSAGRAHAPPRDEAKIIVPFYCDVALAVSAAAAG